MKKLLLCMALLAGMAFTACSEDDPEPTSTNYCVTCTITIQGFTSNEEICNRDGDAYIDNTFVGNFQGWMDLRAEQGYTCD